MIVKIKRLHQEAKVPTKPDKGSGAYDLYSLSAIAVPPHCTVKINTGIALEIPEGYAGIIYDRSGMGRQGYNRHGGFIDSSYRGELGVLLCNTTDNMKYISIHDRIAQIAFQQVEEVEFEAVEELCTTERGEKAWGASGK